MMKRLSFIFIGICVFLFGISIGTAQIFMPFNPYVQSTWNLTFMPQYVSWTSYNPFSFFTLQPFQSAPFSNIRTSQLFPQQQYFPIYYPQYPQQYNFFFSPLTFNLTPQLQSFSLYSLHQDNIYPQPSSIKPLYQQQYTSTYQPQQYNFYNQPLNFSPLQQQRSFSNLIGSISLSNPIHSFFNFDVWKNFIIPAYAEDFSDAFVALKYEYFGEGGPSNIPQMINLDYRIGIFYMPGWKSGSVFWKDIMGTKDSKSPGRSWPDRVPLLGFYPEEEAWIKDWHIKWAIEHGISFFIYDWFWQNGTPHLDHAILAHLRSKYRNFLKFCIMWSNHEPFIPTMEGLTNVSTYWIEHYFNQSNYLMFDDKPVVMVFLPDRVGGDSSNTTKAISSLRENVKIAGYKDIFLVAISNDIPSEGLVHFFKSSGYDAYTPYNYATNLHTKTAYYETLIEEYKANWLEAHEIDDLPYIISATSGWDSRPWEGSDATVVTGSTPEKFKTFLEDAKTFLDFQDGNMIPKMILLNAWNEFGEGAYIEPTVKWGFDFLNAIRAVFSNDSQFHVDENPRDIKQGNNPSRVRASECFFTLR